MLKQGWRAFSRGATGASDLPSCCEGKFGVPLESKQGNQDLARTEGDLSILSTCGRIFHGSSQVTIGETGFLLRCEGKSGFLSSQSRGIGPLLEMRLGTWSFSPVASVNSGFLSGCDG